MDTLDSYDQDGALVLTPLVQRIDAWAAPTFLAEALTLLPGHRSVVVMMQGVERIDSSGLGCLVAVLKAVPPGARLRLVGLRAPLRALFRLTRLEQVFAQSETLEDALAA